MSINTAKNNNMWLHFILNPVLAINKLLTKTFPSINSFFCSLLIVSKVVVKFRYG